MSDPDRRAERAEDNLVRARLRAGDDEGIVDLLEVDEEDEEGSIPDAPTVTEQTVTVGGGIAAPDGQTAATNDELRRLSEVLNKVQRELKEQREFGAKMARKVNAMSRQAKKFQQALKRWAKKYRDSFSEFHHEASSYRDGFEMNLNNLAKLIGGYVDGLNEGEEPSNPQLLAIARAITTGNIGGQMGGLASAALTYLSYSDPLAHNPRTSTGAAASGLLG